MDRVERTAENPCEMSQGTENVSSFLQCSLCLTVNSFFLLFHIFSHLFLFYVTFNFSILLLFFFFLNLRYGLKF